MNEEEGKILIISGPSGVGKTTVADRILEESPNFVNSISVTTREPRGNEKDGVDYFFRDEETFQKMIDNHEFLEAAKVYDHYYGTTRNFVQRKTSEGLNVIFNIDWQGAQIVRKRARVEVISVFLLPPSEEELKKRLESRHSASPEEIVKRLAKAQEEISHQNEYDAVIVNDDLDAVVGQILQMFK